MVEHLVFSVLRVSGNFNLHKEINIEMLQKWCKHVTHVTQTHSLVHTAQPHFVKETVVKKDKKRVIAGQIQWNY